MDRAEAVAVFLVRVDGGGRCERSQSVLCEPQPGSI